MARNAAPRSRTNGRQARAEEGPPDVERGSARPPSRGGDARDEAVSQAFNEGAEFIDALNSLALDALGLRPPIRRRAWKALGELFGRAFVAQNELRFLLTPEVREAVQSVYAVGSPSVKLSGVSAQPTVIESLERLGAHVQSLLYSIESPLDPPLPDMIRATMVEALESGAAASHTKVENRAVIYVDEPSMPDGLSTPLDELMRKLFQAAFAEAFEPGTLVPGLTCAKVRLAHHERLGIKTRKDAVRFMAIEWSKQDPKRVELNLARLRFDSIDFSDLRTQLGRESLAIKIAASHAPESERPERVEPPAPPREPLSAKAAAVYDLLVKLPEHKAMTGPAICTALRQQNPKVFLEQPALTSHIIPELKPYGVSNRRRAGYYIKPEARPSPIAS